MEDKLQYSENMNYDILNIQIINGHRNLATNLFIG